MIRSNCHLKFYIYDNNKELVYEGSKTSEWVSLNNISEYSKDAVISIEDKNFYMSIILTTPAEIRKLNK